MKNKREPENVFLRLPLEICSFVTRSSFLICFKFITFHFFDYGFYTKLTIFCLQILEDRVPEIVTLLFIMLFKRVDMFKEALVLSKFFELFFR